MDTSKLYESCDISRRTTAITAGEETFAETVVFSGLPCYIRPVKANIVESSNEQSNNQGVYVTIDNGHAVQV